MKTDAIRPVIFLFLFVGLFCMALLGCEKEKEEGPNEADLSLSVSISPNSAKPGEIIKYTVTLRNNGPRVSQSTRVVGALSPHVTFVSANNSGSLLGGQVSWDLGEFPANSQAVLELEIRVNAGVAKGTKISLQFTASSSTSDPDQANNSATGEAEVDQLTADVSVTITTQPDPAIAGEQITATITISNAGPDQAANVVVNATLPNDVTFVSADNNGSQSSNRVEWDLGSMASGANKVLTLVVDVKNGLAEGTKIRLNATVRSDTSDPASENNTAAGEAEIGLPPDEGPVEGSVEGVINEEKFDEKESETTVTFNRIPHTIGKFTELQSQIATTPQGAVAMMIIAMRIYQQYPIEGMKCMTATCTSPLVSASSNPGNYEGYIMSNVSTLRQRLAQYDYLPFIYYKGANPQNGYEPDGPPFVVEMYTNLYSYSAAADGVRIKLFVKTRGADSDRPVTVKKVGNIYKVTEYSSLYLGPKPPVK